jgi:hypothetical protein
MLQPPRPKEFPAMVKAMIVFDFPDDIIAAVLSSWIDMQGLARFDSALCVSKARTRFLGWIEDGSIVTDTILMCPRTPLERYTQQLEWLIERRIKVRNCILHATTAYACKKFLRKLLQFNVGANVRSVLLSAPSAQGLSIVACSALRKLQLEDCQPWEAVNSLSASSQHSLQELVIRGCNCVGGRWETKARFPYLKKLHIWKLYGKDVTEFVTGLLSAAPNLTDCRLSGTSDWCPVNDEGLRILCGSAATLEILELITPIPKFTPAAVVSLAKQCSNLKSLALGDRVNVTAVEAFTLYCGQLEGLQIWGPITVATLSAVAQHCGSRLRYLVFDVGDCGPDSLVIIAERCRLLEELQLHYCSDQAVDALVLLVSSLLHLNELFLLHSHVTDEVLNAIATHLPNLVTLGLSGIECRYSPEEALQLVTSLPQLQLCVDWSAAQRFDPAVRVALEDDRRMRVYEHYLVESTRYFEMLRW